MNIKIKTAVSGSFDKVIASFDSKLFQQLNPPFPPVKLLRFDGSKKGDLVALELNFIVFRQSWISEITENYQDLNHFYFVDKGVQLPFFLSQWRHKHVVERNQQGSLIIDDISFRSPFLLMDILLFPVLYLQFLYRKPIYKKYFR